MQEYFCVGISSEFYLGLSLSNVDKLIELQQQELCIVPGVPSFWAGVLNYKGSLLWVLEPEKFLEIPTIQQKFASKKTALILNLQQQHTQKKVALILQGLEGVIQITEGSIKPLSANLSPLFKSLWDGVVEQDNKTIYLVNTAMLSEQLYQQSLLCLSSNL